MTLTGALSELAVEMPSQGIDDQAIGAARKMTLDALACALAGWDAPGVRDVIEQVRAWGGTEEASVLVHGGRCPAPTAAFANSVMIHALDYDDVHIPGTLHIMSVVLPAAMAAAEMADATGRDLLEAVTVGVEVAGRTALWCKSHDTRLWSGALLPTSMHGGFGAVAAAARLLGLSMEQTVNAMGINYAQASGNRQALHDRTLTKRLQPGFAARSALWATALAERGVTGPEEALEGDGGLFNVYYECDPPTVEELLEPRAQWEIERVSVKRHTSCGACHPALFAAQRLREGENLQPEDIVGAEIFGHREGGFVSEPLDLSENPQVAAQFSVQYCVAYALLRGEQKLEDWTEAAILADEEVAEFADRILFGSVPRFWEKERYESPPDFGPYTRKWQGVQVYTTDEWVHDYAMCPAQVFDPDAVSYEDVQAKFRNCAEFSNLCDDECTEALIASVEALASEAPVRESMEAWWGLE